MTSKSIIATRVPDCVTQVRMGNTILTVSGFLKQNATENAIEKMEKVIKSEGIKQAALSYQAS